MEDLIQFDEAIYGPSGGPREYGTAEGRFNGGGWIQGPLATTDFDGPGVWAQPPAADGEKNLTVLGPMMGAYGADPILDAVTRAAGNPSAEGGWY